LFWNADWGKTSGETKHLHGGGSGNRSLQKETKLKKKTKKQRSKLLGAPRNIKKKQK